MMENTSQSTPHNRNELVIVSPVKDLINILSSSGEEFAVEPFSLAELDERFRVAPFPLSDMPTAFMGAAGAMLFPNNGEVPIEAGQHIDTRGSLIENELMLLLDKISNISPLTFIGSSEEQDDSFFGANFANMDQPSRNNYGRPVQRIQPMPRQQRMDQVITNPPMIPSSSSAFTAVIQLQQQQEPAPRPFPQANYLHMPVPFYPNSWNNGGFNQMDYSVQMPQGQQSYHQNRPISSQPILQMNPSVMPEVAGFCSGCNKTYNQIAVETLTHNVAWSEYPDETIRDRNVRSQPFIDGFGAALICFKNAELSASYPCEMSGVQHS